MHRVVGVMTGRGPRTRLSHGPWPEEVHTMRSGQGRERSRRVHQATSDAAAGRVLHRPPDSGGGLILCSADHDDGIESISLHQNHDLHPLEWGAMGTRRIAGPQLRCLINHRL